MSQLPPFASARPGSQGLARSALKKTMPTISKPVVTDRDRALLVRMDATNSGQVYALGRAFSIGRHPQNDACLEDEGISRHHVRLTVDTTGCWLEDLQSSNGTFLNGRRIASRQLTNGDLIQLGPRVSFRFYTASKHEERVMRQMYESTVKDPLTGAYNRQHFADRFKAEFAFATRHRTPLAVLMLDIDYFKKVNDNHGHLAGDTVLRVVSERFARQLRTEDLLARYGGEEFVGVLRGTDLDGAALLGERLRACVADSPVGLDGSQCLPVTISVGVATLRCVAETGAEENPESLISIADRRLYMAKESGRNRVVSIG